MPVQDQAVWKSVTLSIAGQPRHFERGELLPPPSSDLEANNRALLRLGGALRVVEVVFTPEEIAASRGGAGPAQAMADAGIVTATAQVAPDPGTDPRAPLLLGPKPRGQGSKADWVAYAVSRGMAEADAEAMSRDQLAAQYRDEPG